MAKNKGVKLKDISKYKHVKLEDCASALGFPVELADKAVQLLAERYPQMKNFKADRITQHKVKLLTARAEKLKHKPRAAKKFIQQLAKLNQDQVFRFEMFGAHWSLAYGQYTSLVKVPLFA